MSRVLGVGPFAKPARAGPTRAGRSKPTPTDELLAQIKAAGLPEPVLEASVIKGRRWRWDMLWKACPVEHMTRPCGKHCPVIYQSLLMEIQGVYRRGGKRCPACKRPPMGRHASEKGMRGDYEKHNAATLAGYRVVFVTPAMIRDGSALEALEKVLR